MAHLIRTYQTYFRHTYNVHAMGRFKLNWHQIVGYTQLSNLSDLLKNLLDLPIEPTETHTFWNGGTSCTKQHFTWDLHIMYHPGLKSCVNNPFAIYRFTLIIKLIFVVRTMCNVHATERFMLNWHQFVGYHQLSNLADLLENLSFWYVVLFMYQAILPPTPDLGRLAI